MIKSKIEARERALELATDYCREHHLGKLLETAKEIEIYLIGDAELPEVGPSIEDITAKSIVRLLSASNSQNLGAMEFIGGFNNSGNESNS